MNQNLDTAGDVEAIADGATPIVVQCSGRDDLEVAAALMTPSASPDAAEPGLPHAVWRFSLPEGNAAVSPGDRIVEGPRCWRITEVQPTRVDGLLRCLTVADPATNLLTDRVDIEEPVWEGSIIVGWRVTRPATPASIQLLETIVDHTTSPPTSSSRYRVQMAGGVGLEDQHRLRAATGEVFRIEKLRPATSELGLIDIDALLDSSPEA